MTAIRGLLGLGIVIVLGGEFLYSASAQTWVQSNAPFTNWSAVACSADGSKLIAVGGNYTLQPGPIYFSTNSGADWEQATNAPVLPWLSIASSADGTKLVAAAYGNGIYQSLDGGITWNETSAPDSNRWLTVTSSADGTNLAALASKYPPPDVFVSNDSGKTWTPKDSVYDRWSALASSADGRTLVACGGIGTIMASTNSGDSWSTNQFANGLLTAATSADGRLMFAGGSGIHLGILGSTNSGQTWTLLSTNAIQSIACSADGSKLVAANFNSYYQIFSIYSSTNYGSTWDQAAPLGSNHWTAVAWSADGNMRIAAAAGGGIWIAHTAPTSHLNISISGGGTKLSWIVPSIDFALQYSLDLQNWMDITNIPVLNLTNLENQVTFHSSDVSDFFRLKSP